MDRFAQFAVIAAREAVTQSGLELTPELQESSAVVTGSCLGGRGTEETGYWELFHNNRNRVHPLTIPLSMSNAGASHICMQYGIQGPAYTISTACSSSAHAIGQAFWMVRSGQAPMAIAGGSEAPFFLGGLKAWEAMRVISKDTCRPFSLERSGMILGEGAAMLVLEPLEAALARGAKPLAEIVGFGMTADAAHITQPVTSGPARAMAKALADAGLAPEQVTYINAHGTATEANDRTETAAIRSVFGSHADSSPSAPPSPCTATPSVPPEPSKPSPASSPSSTASSRPPPTSSPPTPPATSTSSPTSPARSRSKPSSPTPSPSAASTPSSPSNPSLSHTPYPTDDKRVCGTSSGSSKRVLSSNRSPRLARSARAEYLAVKPELISEAVVRKVC